MNEEILQPNQPAKFEARNLRPKFRRLRSGDIFLIEMELTEEVWNQLRTVPENALLETVLWWHDGDAQIEESANKSDEPKGPHSAYWSRMFTKRFYCRPELIELLECAGNQIKYRLYDIFEVKTMADVSPAQFEDWCASEGLHGLITLSRNAANGVEDAVAQT